MSGSKKFIGLIGIVCIVAAGLIAFIAWPRAPQREAAQGGSQETLGQFSPVVPPRPAPALEFSAGDGQPATLEDFKGHWVLVNLWATWCAPCIKEMPSLDRLQAQFGPLLSVLAISEDHKGAETVDPFVAKLGLKSLKIYLDAGGKLVSSLGVSGLPTSYLIDPDGHIRARLEGAADWDAPKTRNDLEKLMGLNAG
jgi:thiol-disulfide isomerase/thioredoxin